MKIRRTPTAFAFFVFFTDKGKNDLIHRPKAPQLQLKSALRRFNDLTLPYLRTAKSCRLVPVLPNTPQQTGLKWIESFFILHSNLLDFLFDDLRTCCGVDESYDTHILRLVFISQV